MDVDRFGRAMRTGRGDACRECIQIIRHKINQNLRPFETHEGAATRKVKTVSEGAPPADVELKLRLAGMRVVTDQEDFNLPGMPTLYIQVNLADTQAANIEVQLQQNVTLQRNGQSIISIPTWRTSGSLILNPNAQFIRNAVKDHIDRFLNAWLSVNPKK